MNILLSTFFSYKWYYCLIFQYSNYTIYTPSSQLHFIQLLAICLRIPFLEIMILNALLQNTMMRLPTRSSSSGSSVKNAPLTPLSETRRLQELTTCRTTSSSNALTLLNLMKPWLNTGSSKLSSGKTTLQWNSSPG